MVMKRQVEALKVKSKKFGSQKARATVIQVKTQCVMMQKLVCVEGREPLGTPQRRSAPLGEERRGTKRKYRWHPNADRQV